MKVTSKIKAPDQFSHPHPNDKLLNRISMTERSIWKALLQQNGKIQRCIEHVSVTFETGETSHELSQVLIDVKVSFGAPYPGSHQNQVTISATETKRHGIFDQIEWNEQWVTKLTCEAIQRALRDRRYALKQVLEINTPTDVTF